MSDSIPSEDMDIPEAKPAVVLLPAISPRTQVGFTARATYVTCGFCPIACKLTDFRVQLTLHTQSCFFLQKPPQNPQLTNDLLSALKQKQTKSSPLQGALLPRKPEQERPTPRPRPITICGKSRRPFLDCEKSKDLWPKGKSPKAYSFPSSHISLLKNSSKFMNISPSVSLLFWLL